MTRSPVVITKIENSIKNTKGFKMEALVIGISKIFLKIAPLTLQTD